MMQLSDLKIMVPPDVWWILERLRAAGHEAFIVGGCVRDAILGVEPKDWDITTSALPVQVKSLFSNTADTGIQHGTVMVIRHGTGYEVTTYRVDGEYKDGRHPESVTFTPSLAEDLKRRDFTINALAYSPEEGVVDLFDGIGDLRDRKIRCVRDPDERFTEDALRIMRAVRFSAQLSFEIDTASMSAIRRHTENLAKVSMERIRVEFEKTLCSSNPAEVQRFEELGIAPYIVPDPALLPRCFDAAAGPVYAAVLQEEPDGKVLRLAVFFAHLSGDEAKRALRLLKYDNRTIALVSGIIKNQDLMFSADRIGIKQAWNRIGKELFFLTLAFREAFAKAEGEQAFLHAAEEIRSMAASVDAAGEAWSIPQLAVSGSDLMAAGVPAGKQLGVLLQRLTEQVIEHPEWNEKGTLIRLAKEDA